MKRIKYLFFFWATKNYNTLTGMGAIASTGLYNTDKTASNLDSGHTRYQMVPNVEFIRKKKKKRRIHKTISIYCSCGALREEQEVIGTTHKKLV